MTNNPTIDGVSRELLANAANYMEGSASAQVNIWCRDLRALLDAPAVERQEPYGFASVLIDSFRFAIDNGKQPTFSKGDLLWLIEQLSKAQSESDALQSTIARLEARIAELENRNSELGWIVSPDRVGQ